MIKQLKNSIFLATALASTSAFAFSFSAAPIKQDPSATGPLTNPKLVYVPQGCAVPTIASNANGTSIGTSASPHVFYVDPIKGSAKGDGSQAKPWRTLQEVLTTGKVASTSTIGGIVKPKNPNGPIKAGDIILLGSGDHGTASIVDLSNTNFITVAAAPGAKPILHGLTVLGSAKWIFAGLTFENAPAIGSKASTPVTFVNMDGRGTAHGKLENIIFAGNTVHSAADAVALKWGPAEWVASGSNGIQVLDADCVTVAHNTVKNVRFGIGVGGTRINLDHNLVDYFADDALRMVGASNLNIRNNLITNHYGRLDDGNHNDALQGFPPYNDLTRLMHDILIDSNVVIESTGQYATLDTIPGTGAQNYLQGMSEFDGKWKNLTVNNNIVVGSAYHLISNLGGDGVTFTNNTIASVSSNPKVIGWIGAFKGKDGTLPTRVTITNNVAPKVTSNALSSVLTGNYKSTNQAATFVTFDPANASYDFTLKDPKLQAFGAHLPNMKFGKAATTTTPPTTAALKL